MAQFICPTFDVLIEDMLNGANPDVWASIDSNFGREGAVFTSRVSGGLGGEDGAGQMVSNPIALQGYDAVCVSHVDFYGGDPPPSYPPYLKDDGIDQNGQAPAWTSPSLTAPPAR